MSTGIRAPHVVMDVLGFHCLHCGRHYAMNQPAPVNVFTAAINAFVGDHEHCVDARVNAEYTPETPADDPDFREVGQ